MNDPNITDWITAIGTCVIPVALALGPLLVWGFTHPRFKLTADIDPPPDGDYYYLRLKVVNDGRLDFGRKIARKCTGRLIEIRKASGEAEQLPQLNFCWERHNQANPPHPVDVPKRPFEMHLDIAKYAKSEPEIIKLRVDADNQQLPAQWHGKYSTEFRELTMSARTYYVLVSVYTEDGFAKTQWYALNRTKTGYTISEGKPPKS